MDIISWFNLSTLSTELKLYAHNYYVGIICEANGSIGWLLHALPQSLVIVNQISSVTFPPTAINSQCNAVAFTTVALPMPWFS